MNALVISLALWAAAARGPYDAQVRGEIRTVQAGPGTRAALMVDGDLQLLAARRPGLEEELKNLEGATVLVFGYRDQALRPPGIDLLVDDYAIVDVGDGRVPRVGRLAALAQGGETHLLFVDELGRADMLPASWKKRMLENVGAKLWILGRRADDGTFTPTRFRILRPVAPRGTQPGSQR